MALTRAATTTAISFANSSARTSRSGLNIQTTPVSTKPAVTTMNPKTPGEPIQRVNGSSAKVNKRCKGHASKAAAFKAKTFARTNDHPILCKKTKRLTSNAVAIIPTTKNR